MSCYFSECFPFIMSDEACYISVLRFFSMIFTKCFKNSILLSGPNKTSERSSYLFSLVYSNFMNLFQSPLFMGAQIRRSLGHHLLLRLLVLCAPADFEAQSSLL